MSEEASSNTWTYNNQPLLEIPDKAVGFVYEIVNKATGRRYIGKKLFTFTKTKQVKGKKKKIKVESDWQSYWGSNKELVEHVNILGEDRFERNILRICYSRGEMTYYETKLIFQYDAVISENYYNDWVMCRVRKSHIK
jgi:hypothetical protein